MITRVAIENTMHRTILYSENSIMFLVQYLTIGSQVLLLYVEHMRRKVTRKLHNEIKLMFLIFVIVLIFISTILQLASSYNRHFLNLPEEPIEAYSLLMKDQK
ncbi:hypothetical protein NEFER01_0738 [Nematocida sp. LUAm1]|nr:hypothetical protein NEFER01_0738 [Nematocida sp. LUAm1]